MKAKSLSECGVVVLGGTAGVGFETAARFAEEGAQSFGSKVQDTIHYNRGERRFFRGNNRAGRYSVCPAESGTRNSFLPERTSSACLLDCPVRKRSKSFSLGERTSEYVPGRTIF